MVPLGVDEDLESVVRLGVPGWDVRKGSEAPPASDWHPRARKFAIAVDRGRFGRGVSGILPGGISSLPASSIRASGSSETGWGPV